MPAHAERAIDEDRAGGGARPHQGRGEQIEALPKEDGRMKLGCLGSIGLGDRPYRRCGLIGFIDTTDGAAADGCPSVVHYPSFLFLVDMF